MLKRKVPQSGAALTDDRIVSLAASRGYFIVSWRYRDEKMRKRCRGLAKSGRLVLVCSGRGNDRYEAPSLSSPEEG